MDTKTVILALAIGSFVFGALLILFQFRKEQSERIPFWVAAKFMQGTGSLLLYYRDDIPVLASSLLLCGCAYEAWAIFYITGRSVSRRLHLVTAACIVAACSIMMFLNAANGLALNFLIHTIFYGLPGWALLCSGREKSLLRVSLGWGFWILALIFAVRSAWAILIPEQSHLFFGAMIYQIMLPAIYCMMLISGFSMLLLAKEAADRSLQGALREQKAILETLPTGLVILRDRVIERCNPALESMFGYMPGTLLGRPVACLYESAEASEAYGRTIYADIQLYNRFAGEVAAMRRNGERFWVWVQGTSIFPERAQSYAVFSVTDITQQKMQQQLLSRQKEELVVANTAKSMFLKMVAHEFRTPLGLLASSTDIQDRYWERLSSEERYEQNNRIRSAANQLATLTNSILSYNQTEAGYELRPEPLDIGELCRCIAADAVTVWSDRHLFQVTIADDCGSALLDETLLRRILQNLLSNAFRYTPPEGSVELSVKRVGDTLLLEVADSGIGIAEEDRQHIFDAYYRGHNIGIRRGLGLGLAIVRESVELMGGDITVLSSQGQGTAMQVVLPLADAMT